jgi:hypothetical protein
MSGSLKILPTFESQRNPDKGRVKNEDPILAVPLVP